MHLLKAHLLTDSTFTLLLAHYLSTSSLIWPSYTIRATIFEKVFQPKKFPTTDEIALTSRPSYLAGKGAKRWIEKTQTYTTST